MNIFKNLIISIILGLLGYEATKIFLDGGFQVPASTTEINLLLIFIITAFAATFAAGFSGSMQTASDRELGTVKWFNVRKGYGFITRDEGDDVFVHFRNIEGKDRRAISEGQRVSFVVTSGEKGPQADKVNPA